MRGVTLVLGALTVALAACSLDLPNGPEEAPDPREDGVPTPLPVVSEVDRAKPPTTPPFSRSGRPEGPDAGVPMEDAIVVVDAGTSGDASEPEEDAGNEQQTAPDAGGTRDGGGRPDVGDTPPSCDPQTDIDGLVPGQRWQVECYGTLCMCITNGVFVSSCIDPEIRCDFEYGAEIRRASCCYF